MNEQVHARVRRAARLVRESFPQAEVLMFDYDDNLDPRVGLVAVSNAAGGLWSSDGNQFRGQPEIAALLAEACDNARPDMPPHITHPPAHAAYVRCLDVRADAPCAAEVTYAFSYSGDGGQEYRQHSTGLTAADVLFHIQRVAGKFPGVCIEHHGHGAGATTTLSAIGCAWRFTAEAG